MRDFIRFIGLKVEPNQDIFIKDGSQSSSDEKQKVSTEEARELTTIGSANV